MPKVIALAISDIHLSIQPPVARMGEKDWLKAQARTLRQVREIQRDYGVPILCAGDIFDNWRTVPELINFAMITLPQPLLAIPGQHDLPYHDKGQLKKSAFWSLVLAGTVYLDFLEQGVSFHKDFILEGFSYGDEIKQRDLRSKADGKLRIALAHQYIWDKGSSYPGAPAEAHVGKVINKKSPWDVMIFGDNHKGFITRRDNTTVVNCGGLFRRKSDEIGYVPRVNLIYDNATATPYSLNIDDDIIEAVEAKETIIGRDMKEFIEELEELGGMELDFPTAVRMALEQKKVSPGAEKLILKAMEE